MIGMTFGAAYSNQRLPQYWWETSVLARVARGVLVMGAYAGVLAAFGTAVLPNLRSE